MCGKFGFLCQYLEREIWKELEAMLSKDFREFDLDSSWYLNKLILCGINLRLLTRDIVGPILERIEEKIDQIQSERIKSYLV